MANADDCAVQVQACRIRVSKLNADGSPVVGAGASYVSDAFVKFTSTQNNDAANEIKEQNACGSTAIDYLGPPTKLRDDVELDLITPDPHLHAVLISQGTLLVVAGGAVGFQAPPIGPVTGNGVSIELWAKRLIDNALSTVHPYAHWAFPRILNLAMGPKEFGNSAQHSIITGQSYENDNWLDGPFNDFPADSSRTWQWIPTDTLPDIACGPVTVSAS